MKHTSELIRSLNKHFQWNKARITCFAHMLLGLIAVETVNLQKIALGFPSNTEISSRYRRLQRFFASFNVDFVQISRWVFKLFFSKTDKYTARHPNTSRVFFAGQCLNKNQCPERRAV